MATFIRFERDELPTLTFGPFDFVVIDDDCLLIGPNEERFAYYGCGKGWFITNDDNLMLSFFNREMYTAIVIFDADVDLDLTKENEQYHFDAVQSHKNACNTNYDYVE
jgi:hypothetical protein